MTVEAKAKDLAAAIKETTEYEALKSAETRVSLDPKAQDLVNEFQEKHQQLQQAQQSGQPMDQEMVIGIQRLQGEMQQNLTLKNFMKAQDEFNKVMQNVNKVLTDSLSQ